MISATRLRYEALYGAEARRVMGNTYYRFGDVRNFLTTTQRYLAHPDRAPVAGWNLAEGQPSATPLDPAWVEVIDLETSSEGVDVVEEFLSEYVRFVFDEPNDPSRPWSDSSRIAVLDRDSESGCLLLERQPSTDRILVRPDTYVLDRQIRAVYQLQNEPLPSHAPLQRLLDDRDDRVWPAVPDDCPQIDWAFLDDDSRPGVDEQRRFVALGLQSPDFVLLEGPPGSGKTTAICELITQLVAEGLRVLLCASTHVAVDNVLERLDRRADQLGVIAVRIGDRSRCSEAVHHLRLEDRAATERKRLLDHLDVIDSRSYAQDELLDMVRREGGEGVTRLVLDTANVVCGTTIGILQHPDIKVTRDALSEERLFDVLIVDEASKTTFQEMLVPAVLARRWILVGDYRQLSPMDDIGPEATLAQVMRGHDLQAQIGLDLLRLYRGDHLLARTGEGAVSMRGIAVVDDEDGDWWREYEARAWLLGIPVHTEHNLAGARAAGGLLLVRTASVLRDAALSAVTGWQIRSPRLSTDSRAVDTWAREVGWRLSTVYQLRLSDPKERARLEQELGRLYPDPRDDLGDEVQRAVQRVNGLALPSVLECLQTGVSRENRHAATALTEGLPPNCLEHRHVLLRYQHRMHPEISRFPRERFYDDTALQDPPYMLAERSWDYRRYSARVSWADVRGGRQPEEVIQALEADQAIREVEAFATWAARTTRTWEVGVVCFYRQQERLLRKRLQNLCGQPGTRRSFRLGNAVTITLGTIDSFQGHEADLIVLTVGKRRVTSFTASPNRLNVALTRARFQLVIVGDQRAIAGARRGALPALAQSAPVDHTWSNIE